MTITRAFLLRDLLTVTTGRLLTKPRGPDDNGIGALYALLDWMTADAAFTHTLGRFSTECKPWLLRWFPELVKAESDLYALDDFLKVMTPAEAVEQWLAVCVAKGCKAIYDVPRIPKDAHELKAPVRELIEQRGGNDKIIEVRI